MEGIDDRAKRWLEKSAEEAKELKKLRIFKQPSTKPPRHDGAKELAESRQKKGDPSIFDTNDNISNVVERRKQGVPSSVFGQDTIIMEPIPVHELAQKRHSLSQDLDFYYNLLKPATLKNKKTNEMTFQTTPPRSPRLTESPRRRDQYGRKASSGLSVAERRKKYQSRKGITGNAEGQARDLLDAIGEIDDLMSFYKENKYDSDEVQRRLQGQVELMKQHVQKTLSQNKVQIQLVEGQLKRRTEAMDRQREKYLNELTLLREELFRKKADPDYVPQDYHLHDFSEPIKMEEKKEEDSQAAAPRLQSAEEIELYETLRSQTNAITEQLEKLKQLEAKRLKEIDILKKKQLDMETAKNEELAKRDVKIVEVEKSPMEDDGTSSTIGSEMRLRELEEAINASNPMLQLTSEQSSEEIAALQNRIGMFQKNFKGLFKKMKAAKERIAFYKSQSTLNHLNEKVPAPTGKVALVFTDIQGSTRLWELDMSAMQEGIHIHNEIIREELETYLGYEVKTEGDAFMCAFSNASAAVNFALSVQLKLHAYAWSNDLLKCDPCRQERDENGELVFNGIRVRMGIHYGEPIDQLDPVTKRTDYFGPVVNRAARVEGCAQGGQIAISNAVWEEIQSIRDALMTPVTVEELGEVTLKGMDEPEFVRHLYPESLDSREFEDVNEEEVEQESGIESLQTQLLHLEEQHQMMENERLILQNKIRHHQEYRELRSNLEEKDKFIKKLQDKLMHVKMMQHTVTHSKDLSETDRQEMQVELTQKDEALSAEVSTAMENYEKLSMEYAKMKANYDSVVHSFNERLTEEMNAFKSEIMEMNDTVSNKDKQRLFDKKIWEMEKTEMQRQLEDSQSLQVARQQRIQELEAKVQQLQLENKPHSLHHVNATFSSALKEREKQILMLQQELTKLRNQPPPLIKHKEEPIVLEKETKDLQQAIDDQLEWQNKVSWDNLVLDAGDVKRLQSQHNVVQTRRHAINEKPLKNATTQTMATQTTQQHLSSRRVAPREPFVRTSSSTSLSTDIPFSNADFRQSPPAGAQPKTSVSSRINVSIRSQSAQQVSRRIQKNLSSRLPNRPMSQQADRRRLTSSYHPHAFDKPLLRQESASTSKTHRPSSTSSSIHSSLYDHRHDDDDEDSKSVPRPISQSSVRRLTKKKSPRPRPATQQHYRRSIKKPSPVRRPVTSLSRLLQKSNMKKKKVVLPPTSSKTTLLRNNPKQAKKVKKLKHYLSTKQPAHFIPPDERHSLMSTLQSRRHRTFSHVLPSSDDVVDDDDDAFVLDPNASVVLPSAPSFSPMFDEIAQIRRLLGNKHRRLTSLRERFDA
mmetsp:Transcript_10220/g.14961  ORF Transcript_10220/g.14961 Transcript_10220/m.14961 type:complete len:1318 (+) Transcript_10220:19-3972(+)